MRMTVSYVKNNVPNDLRADVMTAFTNEKMIAAVKAIQTVCGYEKVATIEYDHCKLMLDNFEHVFDSMQNGHLTDSWTLLPPKDLTPLVKPHIDKGEEFGWRSMCMGDVVSIGGMIYVVAAQGFLEVDTTG